MIKSLPIPDARSKIRSNEPRNPSNPNPESNMKHRTTLATLALSLSMAAHSATNFVHPGALDSKEDLDFVKAKIAAGAQPWAGQFNILKTIASSGSKTTAPADGNENAQKADGRKAYANALVWYFTGDTRYAELSIGILNVWGRTFEGYALPAANQGNQSQLDAGWIGSLLGPAAEIMRGYAGWNPDDIAMVQTMFKTKFYPALNQMSTWNGNVDLTQIDAMMNLAVFNDDQAEFDLALSRLRRRDTAYFYLSTDRANARNYGGSNENAWSDANGNAPLEWMDGLTQETCRDNTHHAQYAMASAFHAAEIAWHQGVDVYTPNTRRYTAVMELMAKQIVTGTMQGACLDSITSPDRFDTWEIGYNHYHNRMGIDLPNTRTAIMQEIRPKGISDWNIFFETLLHGDVSVTSAVADRSRPNLMSISVMHDGTLGFTPNESGIVEVSVMGLDGRKVARQSLHAIAGQHRKLSLGMEQAPAGVYMVQLREPNNTATVKYTK
jgi:hypothetical protein